MSHPFDMMADMDPTALPTTDEIVAKVLKELETELRIYPINEQVWASARLLARGLKR